MKTLLDKVERSKRIDKESSFSLYKINSKIFINLLDNIKKSPNFQRNLKQEKVEGIKIAANGSNIWYATHGDFILGVISLDKEGNGDYYLLDGQHRLTAIQQTNVDIDIYVKIVHFDSIANMKNYFKSINQNSNLETEYNISENDYCDDIRTYIKKKYELFYPKAFSCRTSTRGNRENIDEHVTLFDNNVIQTVYKNIEYDDGLYLWNVIKNVNNKVKFIFAKYQADNKLHNYLKQSDETPIIQNDYYLCLKNVNFIDCIEDINKNIEIIPLTKLKKENQNKISTI
jgi:hypothetical protein